MVFASVFQTDDSIDEIYCGFSSFVDFCVLSWFWEEMDLKETFGIIIIIYYII